MSSLMLVDIISLYSTCSSITCVQAYIAEKLDPAFEFVRKYQQDALDGQPAGPVQPSDARVAQLAAPLQPSDAYQCHPSTNQYDSKLELTVKLYAVNSPCCPVLMKCTLKAVDLNLNLFWLQIDSE